MKGLANGKDSIYVFCACYLAEATCQYEASEEVHMGPKRNLKIWAMLVQSVLPKSHQCSMVNVAPMCKFPLDYDSCTWDSYWHAKVWAAHRKLALGQWWILWVSPGPQYPQLACKGPIWSCLLGHKDLSLETLDLETTLIWKRQSKMFVFSMREGWPYSPLSIISKLAYRACLRKLIFNNSIELLQLASCFSEEACASLAGSCC